MKRSFILGVIVLTGAALAGWQSVSALQAPAAPAGQGQGKKKQKGRR